MSDIMSTAFSPSASEIDQFETLITPDRFQQLLELAQSGHALAALRHAILETAIAARTGEPVNSPSYA
jgi:hypothetical protein